MPETTQYADLTLAKGLAMAYPDDEVELQKQLASRMQAIASEHSLFRTHCDRMDALYYTETVTAGGADHWSDDPNIDIPGRSHVSVNTFHIYVDVPGSLQAPTPIENMLATEPDSLPARMAAIHKERLYTAWKAEEKFDLQNHKGVIVKGLYGKTAGYVYFDKAKGRPCAKVIQNPRNLWLGYKSDDYEELEWAAHVELRDPNSLMEEFSVYVDVRDSRVEDSTEVVVVPWVNGGEIANQPRPLYNFGPARVETWDYWYRAPKLNRNGSVKRGKMGEPTEMVTWNVVIAGNAVVRGPFAYPEYGGEIPYKALYNTFIPGMPTGRSELHDLEQLIREKMERITSGSQAIAGATAGDFWQLVGPDAPSSSKNGIKPIRNEVVYPGGGNRIEAITPFIAQFQLEQFLGRIDRELAVISGLNELLLGLAPVQSLSSSKAINALVSAYETRLSMRRDLLYAWRKDMVDLVFKVWAYHDKTIKEIEEAGGGTLDIQNPSLSPRDEGETAIRAANLVAAKLISQARGMDMVGVDDPEAEQDIIRQESTDATLWPERVQIMAQLMSLLQTLGLQASQGAQDQAQGQIDSGTSDLRAALGAGTPQIGPGAPSGPEDQGQTPPIPGVPEAAGGAPAPFIQGPAQGAATTQLQTMTQGGSVKGRVLTNRRV